jgi:chlorophyllide a reductase subunit Y
MKEFFEGVGEGYTAGIWEDVPQDHPGFKRKQSARTETPTGEMG